MRLRPMMGVFALAYGEEEDIFLKVQTVKALLNKGVTFSRQGSHEEAVSLLAETAALYEQEQAPEIKLWVARAVFNKGAILSARGNQTEAIKAFDDVLEKLKDAEEPELKQQFAQHFVTREWLWEKTQ